jgi:hypothetical protein
MILSVSGVLTQAEVEKIVRQHIECQTGKKIKRLVAHIGKNLEADGYTPITVQDGFSFELEGETDAKG